jgi:hypothetical protein
MQLKLMIVQVEVMLSVKLKFMKKELRILVDYCSLILQVVRELKIVKAITRTGNKREQKLTNLFLL